MKVWVLLEGGCDWEQIIGVYTEEATMMAERERHIPETKKHHASGYGLSIYETELIGPLPPPEPASA